MRVATAIKINAIMKSSILILGYFENRLAIQAEAIPKRATTESIVTPSKKTGMITHNAIIANAALVSKQRILPNSIPSNLFVLI